MPGGFGWRPVDSGIVRPAVRTSAPDFHQHSHLWRASLSADLVSHPHVGNIVQASGGMAQLVARLHGMEKVRGSNPLTSTAEGPGSDKDPGPSSLLPDGGPDTSRCEY